MEASGLTFYGSFTGRPFEPPPGPPFLAAVSREDGAYELVVFQPGRTRIELDSIARDERYAGRTVEVPDVDRFELDLEIAETLVSGIVVDAEGGRPVADARIWLRGASARSGPDGRFAIAAEAGEQQLEVRAQGRRQASLPIKVGTEGLSDLVVELERGLELRGRVLDGSGRGVPGITVLAIEGGGEITFTDYVETLGDGAFRFDGLGPAAASVVAGGEVPGWAVRGGLVPGGDPVTLVLRPGGRVALRVRGPDGQPRAGVGAAVTRVDGAAFSTTGWPAPPTDASGFAEVAAPSGSVEVEAWGPGQVGRGQTTVRTGETAPLEIVLEATPPANP